MELFLEGNSMTTITDEFMRQMISKTRNYCVVILKAGPKKNEEGAEKIIWEHGRRNFALRADGVLSIVCPISDGSNVAGVGIFNRSEEHTSELQSQSNLVCRLLLEK